MADPAELIANYRAAVIKDNRGPNNVDFQADLAAAEAALLAALTPSHSAEDAAVLDALECAIHDWYQHKTPHPPAMMEAVHAKRQAALARMAGKVPTWQPIESAPKDGTRIILCWKAIGGLSDHRELGRWKAGEGWCNTYGKKFLGGPDFWFALPALPAAPEAGR